MRARRVAIVLVIFASVVALGWVVALIVTGHDNGGLRILAVLPAAAGITLFRIVPKSSAVVAATGADAGAPAQHPALGASLPAPVDIVDR